jgi:hypothetical protein
MNRAGLGRNPMRRRSDRVQAWSRTAFVLLALAIGIPLALGLGRLAYRNSVPPRPPGSSLVAATVGKLEPRAQGGAYLRSQLADVTWPGPDGSVHTGRIAVDTSSRVGSRLPIWVDAHGRTLPPDVSGGDQVFTGLLAGAVAFGACAGLTGAAYASVRYRLDRRRYADWDAQWRRVEPLWSKRRSV